MDIEDLGHLGRCCHGHGEQQQESWCGEERKSRERGGGQRREEEKAARQVRRAGTGRLTERDLNQGNMNSRARDGGHVNGSGGMGVESRLTAEVKAEGISC